MRFQPTSLIYRVPSRGAVRLGPLVIGPGLGSHSGKSLHLEIWAQARGVTGRIWEEGGPETGKPGPSPGQPYTSPMKLCETPPAAAF